MAWLGSATITACGRNSVLVRGLSLAAGATGTIGNYGDATADQQLPSGYTTLISVNYADANVTQIAAGAVYPLVVDIAGTPPQLIVTNQDGGNPTGELRIKLENYHSIVR